MEAGGELVCRSVKGQGLESSKDDGFGRGVLGKRSYWLLTSDPPEIVRMKADSDATKAFKR